MKLSSSLMCLLLASDIGAGTSLIVDAFTIRTNAPALSDGVIAERRGHRARHVFRASSSSPEDCGCGGAEISGRPSDLARTIDPRDAIGRSPILALDGTPTTLNELLGEPREAGVSLVVFLQSLG